MGWIGEAVVEAKIEREGAVGIVPAGVPVVAEVKLVEAGCGHKAGVLVPRYRRNEIDEDDEHDEECEHGGYQDDTVG